MPNSDDHTAQTVIYNIKGVDFRIQKDKDTHGDQQNSLEVFLTPKNYVRFLNHFGHNQKNLNSQNSCYTLIFQHNLSRFNYTKIGEEFKKASPSFLEKTYAHVIHFSKKLFNYYSEEDEHRVVMWMKTLKQCSDEFAALESLVNNPLDTHLHDAIEQLQNTIDCCITNIDAILDQYICIIPHDNKNSKTIITNLRKNLAKTKRLFINNINAQKAILNDEDPRALIFSLQSRRSETAALGTFIADQIITLCAAGIDEVHSIGGGRAAHLHHNHAAIRVLSNTKSDLDAKAKSLHDVALNNDRTPYPQPMVDALNPTEKKGKWLKITDYVDNGLANLEEIDKVICFLTNKSIHDKQTHEHEFSLKIALLLSNIVELSIYTPIHLLFTTLSLTIGTVFYIIPFTIFSGVYITFSLFTDLLIVALTTLPIIKQAFDATMRWIGFESADTALDLLRTNIDTVWDNCKNALKKYGTVLNYQAIDRFAEHYHHKFSPVRLSRENREKGYQRIEDGTQHNQLINQLKGHRISFYNNLLSRYSGKFFTEYFADVLISIVYSATSIVGEVLYLLQPKNAAKRKAIFDNRAKYIDNLKEEINTHIATLRKKIQQQESTISLSPQVAEQKKTSNEMILTEGTNEYWSLIPPHQPNSIPSVLIIPDEMVIGFNRGMIDNAFRNNSFSATILFMVSLTTFGALNVNDPGNLGKLRDLCDFINSKFGQEVIDVGSLKQLMGVTQQWQVLYAGYETTKGIFLGETERLKWILNNSEKITLLCLSAYAAGQFIKYLPTLPTHQISKVAQHFHDLINLVFTKHNKLAHMGLSCSVYLLKSLPLMINSFKNESIDVGLNGVSPFRDFEQAIFGVKFLLIMHSLISKGEHNSHSDEEFHALKEELFHLEEELNDSNQSDREKTALLNNFLQKYKINEVANRISDYYNLPDAEINYLPSHLNRFKYPHPMRKIYSQYSAFEEARKELYDAIAQADEYDEVKRIHQLSNTNQSHYDPTSGTVRNKLYFDYLVEKFDQYNLEAKKAGLYHLTLDDDTYMKDYLHSYFAKNCYEGMSTIIKLISLVFLYPTMIIFIYRGMKQAAASTEMFYSPTTKYQIKMDYAIDKALFLQALSLLAVVARTLTRCFAYVARIGIAAITCPIALFAMPIYGFKTSINLWIDTISTYIAPHRFDGTAKLRPIYADIARVASTNSDDLSVNTSRLLQKLKKDVIAEESSETGILILDDNTLTPSQLTLNDNTADQNETEIARTVAYREKCKNTFFTSYDKENRRTKNLLTALHNKDLHIETQNNYRKDYYNFNVKRGQ